MMRFFNDLRGVLPTSSAAATGFLGRAGPGTGSDA